MVPRFWLPKGRLAIETLAVGALPVPLTPKACGLVLALSVMLTEAERAPVAVGLKVTLMVQVLPAATGLPQVLVWAKSAGFVPATTTLLIFKVMLPVLVRVTLWTELVEPTF